MAISERKKKILAAVVDAYIQTAEPVGSKAIAQNAGLGCSSATIRNELAELVAMGYLEQPHTSAGRVPTAMGYRMYVNELMDQQRLTIEESEDINRRLNQKLKELDDTISDVSRLASQLTNYPAMALTTREAVTILRFDLIYVDANTFIIVVMLSDHTVRNKLVRLPISVDEKMIKKLSTLFNANFTHIGEEAVTPVLISATERSADDTPPADELSLRRRTHPAGGWQFPRQQRGPGPDRTGERGRGAEGLQRGDRQLRRRRQHPRPDRRGGSHPYGLQRRGGKAPLPGRRPFQKAGRGRGAPRGHA